MNFYMYGGHKDTCILYFTLLIIVICVVVFIITFLYPSQDKNTILIRQQLNNINDKLNSQQFPIPNEPVFGPNYPKQTYIAPPVSIYKTMRDYDYRALNNPLNPPLKRDMYDSIPFMFPPEYTSGYSGIFRKVGMLIKREKDGGRYDIMILMGRNKYDGSNIFEYYAIENDKDTMAKFELKNHQELYTGDSVKIHELGCDFEVKIDKTLGYEYNPYIL